MKHTLWNQIGPKGKNNKSMLDKLQLNSKNLKSASVPVEKASNNNIFHSEYDNFKTVTTNQQEQQVSQ